MVSVVEILHPSSLDRKTIEVKDILNPQF